MNKDVMFSSKTDRVGGDGMLNIMSLQNGQLVTGKEINDWCHAQVAGNTSHAREAVRLLKKHYRADAVYVATRDDKHKRVFTLMKPYFE